MTVTWRTLESGDDPFQASSSFFFSRIIIMKIIAGNQGSGSRVQAKQYKVYKVGIQQCLRMHCPLFSPLLRFLLMFSIIETYC